MSDGKIPQGERYVQLNLMDMFGRRGSNSPSSSNSPGNSGSGSRRESSGNNNTNRGDTSEGRGGGPVRNRHNTSRHESNSSSVFSGFRNRDREREREKSGRRERDGDNGNDRYKGRGHRLGGDERPAEQSPSQDEDAGTSDAPVFYQGTSSMLRKSAGKAATLFEMNKKNAPRIVKECPNVSRAIFSHNTQGYLYNALDIKPLGAEYCPQYRLPAGDPDAGKPGCRIRVLNRDTFACAEDLLVRHNFEQSQMEIACKQGNDEPKMHAPDNGVICLNMANALKKGGGFENGSVAQEEALMHRSTLWTTLPTHYYPLTETEAIYSPYVAIYKQLIYKSDGSPDYVNLPRAEAILNSRIPISNANKATLPGLPLPEIAIVSVAAISGPPLTDDSADYKNDQDRALTELKIRQMLRIAGLNGHRRLVLGAFGCGVFANPKEKVARMFLKILREPEFQGGWWKEIVFGCYDPPGSRRPNFPIFQSVLDGEVV
ncbi:hypothetical protein TWF696_002319 [Orbilia brochopaga]|uniref:Microbial-type PARG catalytic domain-containing protein n=1 Tax=Orbilia brochopaga TaxID=3140254 RepID=A0AAV9U410_9PEZI